jgi:serine/threonine protein kinase
MASISALSWNYLGHRWHHWRNLTRPTDFRETLRRRFADRLSTRSRMCIVWVLFMVVCSILLFWSSDVLILYAIDLHPGNTVLVDETIRKNSAGDILRSMDSPVTVEVCGTALGSHSPQYLVLPSTIPIYPGLSSNCKVKLIDFGSASLSGDPSPKMQCPLPFRAPEAVITGSWDKEADIWSLGCTVREQVIRMSGIHLTCC